jgi:predicted enzyme related to lactoylglutathione lyase
MPHINHHPPGAFCWIELGTTDQPAAKSFYSSLFGWNPKDMPMGPSDLYTLFRLEGRDAAAGYTLRADQRAEGVTPHWMIYVTVQNADESAKRVEAFGGKVIAPPFDVFESGRMAVIADPTSAVFCLWQGKKSQGTGITGVPGTLCWADLSTSDPEKVKRFYEGLFGWKIAPGENDTSGYLHIKNGEDFIGGIPPAAHRDPKVRPHWLAYFLVSDVDKTTAQARQQGAKVFVPPMTMEHVGRWSVLADPQGAVFAAFQSASHG